MITKCCSECNEEKALEDFVVSKDRKDGRTNQCLLCRRAYEKRYRNSSNFKTITRQKIIRNAQLKKLYGISYLEYENRYNKQKGLCAICAKDILLLGNQKTQSKVACVDHNHFTQKIRGLLCKDCNIGLGMFKDNPILLHNGALYLQKELNDN